jgi:hypothetical protein
MRDVDGWYNRSGEDREEEAGQRGLRIEIKRHAQVVGNVFTKKRKG